MNEENENNLRRDGDSGLGSPEFAPSDARVLSDAESAKYQKQVEEQLRRQAEEMLAELEEAQGWKLPAGLRRFGSVFMLVAAALMGVFLITETVQFFANLHTLPLWAQYLTTICFGLFGLILVFVVLGLFWNIVKLQSSPRVNLKAIKVLADRQQMQCFAAEKSGEAKVILEKYLHKYPVTEKARRKMLSAGMKEKDWDALTAGRERLLDSAIPLADVQWIDEFQRCFQNILDDAARRRVRQYASRIGVGTAISPIAMLDRMIVLYGCSAMVKDLFVYYNLRPALGQTLVVLSRSVVYAYMSGLVEDATESAVDVIADSISEFGGEGVGVLMGSVGSVVSAKGAEATLNGVLLWRLGKRSITLLQPVRK
ncbi:MAG: DUF697 domain-containing protein [Kiritimatiellae bacterium]|jgi:putative membrane protein|nr:DUF697 domain-containing protein [Kiritimatiellia bacterium]